MTLTIDVKDSGVLALLRDMERLDLLRVTVRETGSPAPARLKMTEAEEIEYINRNADWLNAEAEDVLSYQDLDRWSGATCTGYTAARGMTLKSTAFSWW
jgi:hypothetical protein